MSSTPVSSTPALPADHPSHRFADSAYLTACRNEPSSHVPVWFQRQAGRSLPEYRAIRGEGDILDAIRNPELAAEITLQPVRRQLARVVVVENVDEADGVAAITTVLQGAGAYMWFTQALDPQVHAACPVARARRYWVGIQH